jgi:hypothetical protein
MATVTVMVTMMVNVLRITYGLRQLRYYIRRGGAFHPVRIAGQTPKKKNSGTYLALRAR